LQIEDLGLIEYMVYLRDAVIYNCNQSEKGREYLENCWILEQKKPDRKMLREKFQK